MADNIAADAAHASDGSATPPTEVAPPAASEPAAAAPEPAVESQAQANGEPSDPPSEPDANEPARKPKADRIKELIAERNFWRQRAVAGTPAKPADPETPPQPEGPPTLEQFGHDTTAWSKAFAEYHEKRSAQVVDQHLARRQEAEQQRVAAETFVSREDAFAASTPEYVEAVSDPTLQQYVTPVISETVVTSEIGPQLSYYLATHRDELAAISRLRPTLQAVALGKLEARLANAPATPATPAPKPKPVQQTRAPAPPTPVGNGSAPSKRPEDMTIDEYMAHRQRWANRS